MNSPKAHHRQAERAELKRLLETGASIQMLAPRRIGKTWVMGRLAEDLRAEGWLCIAIDLEGMRTEEQFLRTLCQEIEKHQEISDSVFHQLAQRFKQLKHGSGAVSLVQLLSGNDPRQFSESLVESLGKSGRKTAILIDEISLFAMELAKKDPDETRALLYHLRKLRQGFPKIGWLLTGSIGLDVVGRRLELQGALVGLDIFELQQFTPAEAKAFIEELRDDKLLQTPFDFGDGAFERLTRELGWLSPFYLRLLAKNIGPSFPAQTNRRAIATIADVEAAFEKLLAHSQRSNFATWQEYPTKNFPAEQTKQLHAALAILCENSEGEQAAMILARFSEAFPNATRREMMDRLTDLASGGYLEERGDRWRFRSGLLRRYWAKWMT